MQRLIADLRLRETKSCVLLFCLHTVMFLTGEAEDILQSGHIYGTECMYEGYMRDGGSE